MDCNIDLSQFTAIVKEWEKLLCEEEELFLQTVVPKYLPKSTEMLINVYWGSEVMYVSFLIPSGPTCCTTVPIKQWLKFLKLVNRKSR